MRSDDMTASVLTGSHLIFTENTRSLTLDEALFSAGGYRSILGIAKHVAGWSAVYHSFAFDREPRGWDETDWPRGLVDRIDPSQAYLAEVLAWYERSYGRWITSLDGADPDAPTRLHWGATLPLRDVVMLVASHWTYHAGEVNALLAVCRGEAWEESEEVEENHISTVGHRVRPAWLDPP